MPNQWPEIIKIALGGFVALSVSLYVAPGLISAAERYGIVDHPNNPLKQQKTSGLFRRFGYLYRFCSGLGRDNAV